MSEATNPMGVEKGEKRCIDVIDDNSELKSIIFNYNWTSLNQYPKTITKYCIRISLYYNWEIFVFCPPEKLSQVRHCG